MTLPASGSIRTVNVNLEMNISPTTTALTLNNTQLRNLAQKSSGGITMDNLHGKYQNSYTIISKTGADTNLMAGTTDSSGNIYFVVYNGSTYTIIKFDQWYAVQWQKQITTSVTNVKVDSSGNVYAIGYRGTSALGLSVTKLDSSGAVVWAKSYQLTSYLTNYPNLTPVNGGEVAIDGSGILYLPFSLNAPSSSYTSSSGFIKINAGTGAYVANYGLAPGVPNSAFIIYTMAQDSTAGNFVFGGYSSYSYPSLPIIYKISSTGTVAWQKTLSNSFGVIYKIVVDSSGNSYVLGDRDGDSKVSFLIKFDSSGTVLWSRTQAAYANVQLRGMQILPSGNICIYGSFYDGSMYRGAYMVYNASGVFQFSRGVTNDQFRIQSFSTGLFGCDVYNNVSTCISLYSGTYYNLLLTKAPMLNVTNKFATTTLGGNNFAFGNSVTGITDATGSITATTTAFSAFSQPTEQTNTESYTTSAGSLTLSVSGMAY